MDSAILVRALHVLGVVLWIGGVAFVTSALLPAVRRLKTPEERVAFFEAVEGRFAWQARGTTLLNRWSCTAGSQSGRDATRRERSAGSSGCTGCCSP